MKLLSVQIRNFRSVEDMSFDIPTLTDNSFTYGLIGINEAGKSSILKAIALKDGLVPLTTKDFRDKKKPVEILFHYQITPKEVLVYQNELADLRAKGLIDDQTTVLSSIASLGKAFGVGNKVSISYSFSPTNLSEPIVSLTTDDPQSVLPVYKQHILDNVHRAIFWTAEDKYLISQPISLDSFSKDPTLSVPLKNCFTLAGIEDIKSSVSGLSDSTEKEQLEERLGEKVTEHIKAVWPNHPIKITFDIDNSIINFHVKDSDAVGEKAKTADQRSDGFKQFISFLLTVSAQNKNEHLNNAILLLDEPETHLHPQAQEHLLGELVKIAKNDRNNIVFFATHSNYMIDKNELSRNYKIEKVGGKTIKNRFNKSISTYASVGYEVFNIPSNDYHNELYATLHAKFQDADLEDKDRELIKSFDRYLHKGGKKQIPLDKPNTRSKTPNDASLPTYIRNCINHPDNGYTFSKDELKQSIELLRSF